MATQLSNLNTKHKHNQPFYLFHFVHLQTEMFIWGSGEISHRHKASSSSQQTVLVVILTHPGVSQISEYGCGNCDIYLAPVT